MYRVLTIFCFLLFIAYGSECQVLPKEGSVLNYRIIGFSFPENSKAGSYKLDIAAGRFNNEDSFNRHVVSSVKSRNNKIICEVPSFASEYTWRITATGADMAKTGVSLHHFKTGYAIFVDSSVVRLRIIDPATRYNDHYIFSDASRTLYDMKGKPVWYLPGFTDNQAIRDLKQTPQGSVTFLENENAYEADYNGTILWRGPAEGSISGDTAEHFHHELTKVSNGDYMVLGMESVLWKHKLPAPIDSSQVLDPIKKAKQDSILTHEKTQFGTIIEYNAKGDIVWYWKCSKYFMESDLKYYHPVYGFRTIDVHENAFYFNEKDSVIYVSFKNISRLLKIKYPSGDVINAYGEIYQEDGRQAPNTLFCDQHSCRQSKSGELYMFNNNSCNESSELPEVLLLQEPTDGGNLLKKVWAYNCQIGGLDTEKRYKMQERKQKALEKVQQMRLAKNQSMLPSGTNLNPHATTGGNVIELPDGSFFVCMNSQYGKIFIVNRKKEVLFAALTERWRPADKKWVAMPQQYRASIITRQEMERMVWSTEANEASSK